MLLTLVIAYLLVTIAIGLVAAKRVKTSADFAIAGRHLPLAMIVTTTFATWFGFQFVVWRRHQHAGWHGHWSCFNLGLHLVWGHVVGCHYRLYSNDHFGGGLGCFGGLRR